MSYYVSGIDYNATPENTIVVHGNLPNPSYRIENTGFNINGSEISITIETYEDTQSMYADMLKPFSIAINLGYLNDAKNFQKIIFVG
jgi:hypothetical protein